ncbi:hypothetical protein Dsin_002686 [Dipteronia sinensis]|uniref:FAF domain-containing protein n=1 Tax=Dipteronia sinensis TaxID=43782 RepID=A0AAE0B7J5_9ROSI|nr:hypothetical protein Dsin_002686 [Dipteronia sinensis]
METPKKPEEKGNCTTTNTSSLERGLKALTICSDNDHKHCNSCIMTSNLMSPPSSPSFSHIGDYMGMESCVDLIKNDEFMNLTTTTMDSDDDEASKRRQQRWAMKEKKKKKKERDIPPPISLLARTENLSSHMPFVLKRYYPGDGRLILREEKVKHHEYFKAHRSNGHLTLQLVPLDHDDPPEDVDDSGEEEEEEEVLESGDDDDDDCGEKNDNGDENESVGIGGNNGNNKCIDYSSVRMNSSCFLGVPVPAIKPIHG